MRSIVSLLAALVMTPAPLHQQGVTFSSRADAVRIDALVMDGRAPVTGLVASDFSVFDNGIQQQHRLLASEDVPADIELVVDRSDSMTERDFQVLVAAVRQVTANLRPIDRLGLTTFTHVIQGRWDLTRVRDDLLPSSITPVRQGGTALFDAVFTTIARARSGVRSLVIVISDGEDTASWLPEARVLTAAERSDVTMYAIALPRRDARPWQPEPKENFLTRSAAVTGGRVLGAGSKIGEQLTHILSEFRNRYILAFEPTAPPASGWHRIEVKTSRGKVTARRGYFISR